MRHICAGLMAGLIALAGAAATEPKEKAQITLGWHDCSAPMLLFPPSDGTTIRISTIAYDSGGYVASFLEELAAPGAPAVALHVTTDPFNGCPTRTAHVSGASGVRGASQYGDFKSGAAAGLVGFTPKDLGGVVLTEAGDSALKNEFAYDAQGQRRLSRQEFAIGGTTYSVEFSHVVTDKGRLVGYDARLVVVKK